MKLRTMMAVLGTTAMLTAWGVTPPTTADVWAQNQGGDSRARGGNAGRGGDTVAVGGNVGDIIANGDGGRGGDVNVRANDGSAITTGNAGRGGDGAFASGGFGGFGGTTESNGGGGGGGGGGGDVNVGGRP